MDATRSSETLVSYDNATRCPNTEDRDFSAHNSSPMDSILSHISPVST